MDHLFKAVTILDKHSPYNGKQLDILLVGGQIAKIGERLEADHVHVVDVPGLCCSLGWFDIGAFTGEPGLEQRETLENFMKAAAYGGYTEVACLPNVAPITQTRATVEFFNRQTNSAFVRLHPIAAVTHNLEGRDLTELLDLHAAGAVAYSDGFSSLQEADTLLKALEYLKLFNGTLINHAENKKVANGGQMHEGVASTRLGLKGNPALAEELQIHRDLQLLKYAGGKIHFTQLSTAAGVQAIRAAKEAGLQVSCDVAAHQGAFVDETIVPFDTNYKVSPPFRSDLDKAAIVTALADGTINTLVSAHTPWDEEAKELEFDLAEPGIIGLQTAFSVANGTFGEYLALEHLIEKFSYGPREILGLPLPTLAEGCLANLTFFHPTKKWVLKESNNASAAKNSPFFGKELTGCVYATCINGHITVNPSFIN